jgi:hypothetical protein
MGLFKKKPDPVSERERMLDNQIASLEAQIKQLSTRLTEPGAASHLPPQPRLRSTAIPHGPTLASRTASSAPAPEPTIEEVGSNPFQPSAEPAAPPPPSELGVRKEGLASFWGHLKRHLQGPTTTNPKLVNYLAAGSIQGLRPLRYEKRVARTRFIVLVALLILLLLGSYFALIRH